MAAVVAVVSAVAITTGWGGGGGTGQPAGAEAAADPVGQQLAAVRAATAKYQRVEEALADGYIADPFCIASPAGAMGIHYVKPSLMDGNLSPAEPEILLYVQDGQGRPSLVAVEFFKPDADQNLATSEDRPSLFGQPFDGPMAGHTPVMPIHYDLHVWLWQHNPAGMFAQFNPALSCP